MHPIEAYLYVKGAAIQASPNSGIPESGPPTPKSAGLNLP